MNKWLRTRGRNGLVAAKRRVLTYQGLSPKRLISRRRKHQNPLLRQFIQGKAASWLRREPLQALAEARKEGGNVSDRSHTVAQFDQRRGKRAELEYLDTPVR